MHYFDDILSLQGKVPNSSPLRMHSVILNTIPNFDGHGGLNPVLEIYQSGKLISSTAVAPSSQLILRDEFTLAIRTRDPVASNQPLRIEKDIEIRIAHQTQHRLVVIFSFVFNTGFMGSGFLFQLVYADERAIRVRRSELELPARDQHDTSRIHADFSIDLILSDLDDGDKSRHAVSYESFIDHLFSKSLAKLTQYHTVNSDATLMRHLEEQGYNKILGTFSLVHALIY
jgi:hypothetical protein